MRREPRVAHGLLGKVEHLVTPNHHFSRRNLDFPGKNLHFLVKNLQIYI